MQEKYTSTIVHKLKYDFPQMLYRSFGTRYTEHVKALTQALIIQTLQNIYLISIILIQH